MGQHVLDDARVGTGQGESVAQAHVEPPEKLGLLGAQRGVRARGLGVEGVRVEAEQTGEALPQQAGRGPGGRNRHDVHPVGREVRAPPLHDGGKVLDLPEPARAFPVVADGGDELPQGHRRAVLDVLLPLRGDLAHEVPRGQHHVDLPRTRQGRDGPAGLLGRGGGEQLVRDQDVVAGLTPPRRPCGPTCPRRAAGGGHVPPGHARRARPGSGRGSAPAAAADPASVRGLAGSTGRSAGRWSRSSGCRRGGRRASGARDGNGTPAHPNGGRTRDRCPVPPRARRRSASAPRAANE